MPVVRYPARHPISPMARQPVHRIGRRSSRRILRSMIMGALATLIALVIGTTWYRTVSAPALLSAEKIIVPALVAAPTQAAPPPQETQVAPGLVAAPETPVPTPIPQDSTTPAPPFFYYTQAGDTLPAVASRFGVKVAEILSPVTIPPETFIDPGQLLIISNQLGIIQTSSSNQIMPDSEVVYSPSAVDFDVQGYVTKAGGYLNSYTEYLGTTGTTRGADIIARVATEHSINPRLLLALIEYQSHWVFGQPTNLAERDYPLGLVDFQKKGLYFQLTWAVSQLSQGYYGWRDGTLTFLTFPDGRTLRLAPDLNAGTVAVLNLFSALKNIELWAGSLYGPGSLSALHSKLFGNLWLRAETVEPLFPATLTQPELILPFAPNLIWAFTGGPHAAWGAAGARAAIDFAPGSTVSGCFDTYLYVEASAPGLVVRSGYGVVVIDLDGDGHEETGWDLMYLHIANDGRVPVGTKVKTGDPIGHPSCEGGQATGTHVHFARKFNGEWILADGPIPFVLNGWRVHAGVKEYEGWMEKSGQIVKACACTSPDTYIQR